jgi:ABC-type antimicrobial peptide transport system permease subunit
MAIREDTYRTVYLNAFQGSSVPSHFMLRTSIAPQAVTDDVRRAVRDVIPAASVGNVITLADQIDGSIVPERLAALISGMFGALGSILTAIGLYGLLAYAVVRRVKEIGVRMALGASRSDMSRMVLGDALVMVLLGLAIGTPVAFWCRPFAASMMQDLPNNSALPIVLGVLAMIAIALVAAYIPVRRASRVDPMDALRCE